MGQRPTGLRRFSLAGLMALVVACAVAFAALRSGSEVWASTLFTAAMLALMVAWIGVVCRRGKARAFWAGFAIVGWGYAILAFNPWVTLGAAAPPLLPSKLFNWLAPIVQPGATSGLPATNSTFTPDGRIISVSAGGAIQVWDTSGNRWLYSTTLIGQIPIGFFQIGHSLVILILALIGGRLAVAWWSHGGETDQIDRPREPDIES